MRASINRNIGDVDVAIIGAGPAGCAAAIELARAGHDVIALDKASFPRDKCCGDGLTTGALRRLERLGLDPARVASFTPIGTLAIRSTSGRLARIGLDYRDGIYGAVARRRDLDAALVDLTREAGAEVLEQCAVTDIRRGDDRIVLGTEHGTEISARFVVVADGAHSPTRRLLEQTASRPRTRLDGNEWIAFRTYVEGIKPSARNAMWVWFEESILPGYAWLFPIGERHGNVGLFIRRSPHMAGAALQAAWKAMLEDQFLGSLLEDRATFDNASRAWPIPTDVGSVALHALDGRVLFIGDAARSADPFSGEGVAQALDTGTAAARAISTATYDPHRAGQLYERAINASLALDHRLARASSRVMRNAKRERLVVASCARSQLLAHQVGRWLFEDYPRAAPLKPRELMTVLKPAPGPYVGRDQSSSATT